MRQQRSSNGQVMESTNSSPDSAPAAKLGSIGDNRVEETMFAQLFENFRRASESSLQAQQDLFRQWVQQWPSTPVSSPGTAGEWSEAVQKRWLDSAKDSLNKRRELLDAS